MCYRRLFCVSAALLALCSGLSLECLAQSADMVDPMVVVDSDPEAEPAEPDFARSTRQSFLFWFLGALGWRYTFLLPAVTLLSFILLLIVVFRGRGWAAGAAAVLLVPLPLLVGLMGTIDGLIATHLALASRDVAPLPSHIGEAYGTALVTPLVGICLMVPNYWLAVTCLFVRSLRDDRDKR